MTPKQRRRTLRNTLIATLYQSEERPTMREIGNSFGMTGEAIRRILAKQGVVSRPPGKREFPRAICATKGCSKRVPNTVRKYCSPAHNPKRDRGFVTFRCAWCGKAVQERRTEWEHKQKHWARNRFRKSPQVNHFCNNICKGRYVGQNYGFVAHPENTRRRAAP